MRALRAAACAFGLLLSDSQAQEDPGKERVGQILVSVYYATDGDPSLAGAKAAEVPEALADRLQKDERLRFGHYRALGRDTQPLYRSYENWAQPLKPSDEVLVRFEARSKPTVESVRLDLELWLSRKKIMKTDATVERGRPLFVLGPRWRGGQLIIAVALAPDEKQGS